MRVAGCSGCKVAVVVGEVGEVGVRVAVVTGVAVVGGEVGVRVAGCGVAGLPLLEVRRSQPDAKSSA